MLENRQPLILGFCSAAEPEISIRQLDGVVRYVEEQAGAVAVRDFRCPEPLEAPARSAAPPWTGLADGVLVGYPSAGRADGVDNVREWLTRGGVPVVSLTSAWAHHEIPLIDADGLAVTRLAAKYFIDLGYQQFALVGHADGAHEHGGSRQQFAQALAAHGFQPRICNLSFVPTGSAADLERAAQELELIELLQSTPKPLALFGQNDHYARVICRLCERLGLHVPHDVAILGSGNFPSSRSQSPAISTVETPHERIGYEAARQLHALMCGQAVDVKQTLVAPVGVIERQSTGTQVVHENDVEAANKFIQEHACDGIRVDDVVRMLSISRRTLESHFAKRWQQSPKQMIQQLRWERARHLLWRTQLSVTLVAHMTGFGELSAFTNFVRKIAGKSPSDVRAEVTLEPPAL